MSFGNSFHALQEQKHLPEYTTQCHRDFVSFDGFFVQRILMT